MINDRSVVGVRGFTANATQFYEAASVAPFNQAADGGLAAYVTFWIMSNILVEGSGFTPVFLWSNIDLVAHTGWSLSIVANGSGQPVLQALYGDGAAEFDASLNLLGDGPAFSANSPNWIERLIQAVLFVAPSGDITLTVNGMIIATNTNGGAYAASANPARLGCSPAGIDSAGDIAIVGCGYYGSSFTPRLVCGQMYQAARESIQGGAKIIQQTQLDWTHRYEFGAAAQNLATPAGILVTPAGPSVVGPPPPVTLNDLAIADGNPPILNPPVAAQVALTRAAGATGLELFGVKNPEWYQGGSLLNWGGVA